MIAFTIVPGESHDSVCDCCGQQSRTVSGFVYRGDDVGVAYFDQWTVGGVDSHGAHFDIILGKWGEGATGSDRVAVALEFRHMEQGRSFRVIDASGRPAGRSSLVGSALARAAIIGTPLARVAFDIVDAVWILDSRIREVVGAAG